MCDNIDLNTVVQEFEAYHFAKFQRYPKIVKPVKDLLGKDAFTVHVLFYNRITGQIYLFHIVPGHKSHWYDIRFGNGMRLVSRLESPCFIDIHIT